MLLIAFVGLSIIWNRSIKEELATQATSFVRKGMLSTDMRGVSESLNGIQLSAFDSVTLYHASGERIVTLPPIFDYKEQMRSSWRPFLYDTIDTDIRVDRDGMDKLGTLVFSYYRFELVKYAALVWIFASIGLWLLVSPATRKVQAEIQKEIRLRNAEATEEIAKKIRHNIRSPLAVLNALFVDRTIDKESFFEQGQSAVQRFEEIVAEIKADFQKVPRKSNSSPPIYEITKLVERIIDEKRVTAKNVEIKLESNVNGLPVYCELPGAELKATLSNLIDNSFQALDGDGQVTVRLDCDEHSVLLEVSDTGHGISQSIVQHVFDKGFTYGKEGGTGLGLYYAKKLVEDYQGNIDIRSLEGAGTTVALHVPRKPTPTWHVAELKLSQAVEVVVCDDVQAILKAWQIRFKSLHKAPQATFFTSTEAIPQPSTLRPAMYLVDYDLGDGYETGLDFARRLENRSQLVLVTGHFDVSEIQEACAAIGCKLLPKDEIAQVQIS